MNNTFQSWYLALLKKQVEEEIQFLISNGHQAEKIANPCMFCIDSYKGYYRCTRLTELKQFASSIAVNIAMQQKENKSRKAIGYEAAEIATDNLLTTPFEDSQPLIVIK